MSRNRQLAITFILLGSASIAGGIGLKEYFDYSMVIGAVCGMVFQILALVYAIKQNVEKHSM